MVKAQRGTIDVLPTESAKWQFLEENARKICSLHNIKEIRTPVFEGTELFVRSSGESSDVVNKEMYTFDDKGGRSITLRPEGTAGIVRACVEHGLFNESLPLKLFYLISAYRYEKPQAGRLREFRQFGVELFGSNSVKMVAEALEVGKDYLNSIGIKNVKAKINTLGCKECREKYTLALKKYFENNIDSMCEDCHRRLNQNPLRILDCKVDICKEIAKNAPKVSEVLCDDCKQYFASLQEVLKCKNIDYEVDESIIRGLDYYTGVVFEFETTDIQGSSAVVGGGGQYNNLVEELGGPSVPAVGFAFGIERLLMLLEAQMAGKVFDKPLEALIITMNNDKEYSNFEQKVLSILRNNGISADVDYMDRSFRANFKYANKIQAKFVCVVGEEELKKNSVNLKNMLTGEQKLVKLDDLVCEIKG